MSFQRYKDYKDSGIEWVDKLPSCWKLAKLRWLATLYSGGTPDKEKLFFWENGTIPWLSSGAVNERIIDRPSTYITKEAFENSSAKWIPEGAIVMALAGQGKTKGMVARMAISSTCNQSMAAIVPSSELYSSYLFWWLDSNYQNIRNMAGGDLRDGLNLELLGNIPCPLPQYAEQQSIAAFLDAETARIDSLIADYEALMALLREERQAVISHAVTKGLNPDVPMKDSGIEWLGEVPEHWGKATLKQLVAGIESGVSVNATDISAEPGEIAVLKTSCVYGGHFSITENKTVAPHDISRVSCPIRAGTLIVSRMNTPKLVGESGLVRESRDHIYLPDRLWQVHFKEISTEYVYFWSRTQSYRIQVEMACDGASSSMQSFSKEDYLSFMLPLPPFSEQQAISAFLDAETARMDSLIQDAVTAIHLLQGRRTALISDAVTGKIDVRGLQ